MSKSSPRITLSIGRDSDGPRTVGDVNAFGICFAFYQAWMYMAVFGAERTFRASDLLPWLPFFPASQEGVLAYSFLAASAICLLVMACLKKTLDGLMGRRRFVVAAAACCLAGTLCLCIGGGFGMGGTVACGTLMGIGASGFLVKWGNAFSRFEFATSVINTAIAFALGFIMAVAFTNWIPSPFPGLLATLMPLAMAFAFWRRGTAPVSGVSESGLDIKYVRGYLVKFAICLVFFGFVLGALRALCATQLIAFSRVSVELALGLGCIVSMIVLLGAMIFSRRETSWDSLFRFVSPAIVIGVVGIALLLGDYSIFGCFCVSMGYVCLGALLWIFLSNMAKSLDGSSIFVFGLGYGVLQALSIAGVLVESMMVESALQSEPAVMEARVSNVALMLVVAMAFGYAVLPRYRELKAVISSYIKDLYADGGWSITVETPAPTATETAEEVPIAEETAVDVSDPSMPPPSEEAEQAEEVPAVLDSFDDEYMEISTGREVEYAVTVTASSEELDVSDYETDQMRERGSFTRRCDEIATMYILSDREREVLFHLAKGHNAAFIQDRLCISRSTAKTHINHIYKKMNIHTQQELLNMVEDRERGPRRPLGTEIDRDTLREAVRHANEESPVESDPSRLKRQIERDIFGGR